MSEWVQGGQGPVGPAGPAGATGATGPTGPAGPVDEVALRDAADDLTAPLDCNAQTVVAGAFVTAAAMPPTAGLLRSANPEVHVMTTNGAGADVQVLRSFGSTSHVIGDPAHTLGIYIEQANASGETYFRTNGATVITLGSSGITFGIAGGQPILNISSLRFAIGATGTILSGNGSTKVQITDAGIGVFGHAVAGQQVDFVALTDNTGGTADDTLEGVGALFSQNDINNNFASLAAKVNAIRDVLRAHGWMA